MRLKHLVAALQDVDTFDKPKYTLEQYKTGAELAAQVVYVAATSYGDVKGKVVADLGCGTGVLGIGAELMGAAHVVGFDVDPDALRVAAGNVSDMEVGMDLVQVDVAASWGGASGGCVRMARPLDAAGADSDGCAAGGRPGAGSAPWGGVFDTVITNPPFGTRVAGVDTQFVRAAHALTTPTGVIYSLHKSSTRAHWPRVAEALGSSVRVVAELAFDVPAMYDFHRKDVVDVEVDLLRWDKGARMGMTATADTTVRRREEWEGGDGGGDGGGGAVVPGTRTSTTAAATAGAGAWRGRDVDMAPCTGSHGGRGGGGGRGRGRGGGGRGGSGGRGGRVGK